MTGDERRLRIRAKLEVIATGLLIDSHYSVFRVLSRFLLRFDCPFCATTARDVVPELVRSQLERGATRDHHLARIARIHTGYLDCEGRAHRCVDEREVAQPADAAL